VLGIAGLVTGVIALVDAFRGAGWASGAFGVLNIFARPDPDRDPILGALARRGVRQPGRLGRIATISARSPGAAGAWANDLGRSVARGSAIPGNEREEPDGQNARQNCGCLIVQGVLAILFGATAIMMPI